MAKYPILPDSITINPIEDIRAGAHSDYGSVTLLFRLPGQPGLEVLTPSGEWEAVPVHPESSSSTDVLPVLVNIGDLLSYWTNGLLKSTVHRVIFPTDHHGAKPAEDRYSIVYFCHPEDTVELVEIPSDAVRKHGSTAGEDKSLHTGLTARDHLNQRLAATYS